jgi:hypothetical protein
MDRYVGKLAFPFFHESGEGRGVVEVPMGKNNERNRDLFFREKIENGIGIVARVDK